MADETHPVEVAKIQTEVDRPENCPQVEADTTLQTGGATQGDPFYPVISAGVFMYDSHMCTPDRLHDPTIVACAQLGSGLRVYDIRDPGKPKEIAYYNTGTVSAADPTLDWAFARPVIRTDLAQIWWVTNLEGFRVAQFRPGVWPFNDTNLCPAGSDYFLAQYDLDYPGCQTGPATKRPSSHAVSALERTPSPVPSPQSTVAARRAAVDSLFLCHLLNPWRSGHPWADGRPTAAWLTNHGS
jgi:hypothetical protein